MDALLLRAERAFLRALPELVLKSSGKLSLIRSVEERKFGGSYLRVEATDKGFRWGWLLIELDAKAKSVRAIHLDPEGFANAFSPHRDCFGEVVDFAGSFDSDILRD